MEIQKIKCSSKKHENIDAILFCQACKVYMCNKCSNHHSELFEDHIKYDLKEDIEFFTGICSEPNHKKELEYFCKTHNKLCCVACISKIKSKGYGQHSNCQVCNIEEIKDEKKNKLKENIKYLENASTKIENAINNIKQIIEKINLKKEELKLNIQIIFTKIRNVLNEREDQLLIEVEEKVNSLNFNEDILKKSEAIPQNIKIYLDKRKILDNEWNDNDKLKELINDCINIENNINFIDKINKNLQKYNEYNVNFQFTPLNEELNEFLNKIKKFGTTFITMEKNNGGKLNSIIGFNKNEIPIIEHKSDKPSFSFEEINGGKMSSIIQTSLTDYKELNNL